MTVLFLVGVQTALFMPAKYGILPELLPHEDLSEGNGLLETISNLTLLGGLVCGGFIYNGVRAHLFLAPLLLAVFSAMGLLAALKIPLLAPARSEGGLVATIRIAWSSIRSDRVLGLALLGQIFVWTIGTLVPPPIMAYDAAQLGLRDWQVEPSPGRDGHRRGNRLPARRQDLRRDGGIRALALRHAWTVRHDTRFRVDRPADTRHGRGAGLLGLFSGFLIVPLNALIQWRSPPDRRGAILAVDECPGLRRHADRLGAGARSGRPRHRRPRNVSGNVGRSRVRIPLVARTRAPGISAIPHGRPGSHRFIACEPSAGRTYPRREAPC